MRTNRTPVIDGHVHLFDSKRIARKIMTAFNEKFEIPEGNYGVGTVDDLVETLDRSGIDFAVIANFSDARYVDGVNNFTLVESKNNKRLIPLVSVHPELDKPLAELLNSYKKRGAKGLKLHPMAQEFEPSDKRLDTVYSWCSDNSFPIVFHCGRVANARINEFADLDRIIPVVKKYPDVDFILTHMVDGSEEDIRSTVGRFENVYIDTSIVMTGHPDFLRFNEPSWHDDERFIRIVREVGVERFFFGSDYPWGSPYYDSLRFRGMTLTENERTMILGGNAARIFKIGNQENGS
jgi:predicted TIM-barrel fold metal-dependent hydrolase